jgi:hypothetical protein
VTDREKALVRASMVSKAYREQVGAWGSDEEVLSDLLADLMHLVDALLVDREIGEGFDDLLGTARMNYEAEKEGSE